VYQSGYYQLNETNVGKWIKDNLQSEYHPAGSCAMMPESKGGVVDEKFGLYGVSDLMFPLMPRGNLQTLIYAIAERAADFIKEHAGDV
jgi:choline dehydrogenase-like flavoprotein